MDALPFLSLLKGRDLHDIVGGAGIFMMSSGIGDIVVMSKLYFCQTTGLYWSRPVKTCPWTGAGPEKTSLLGSGPVSDLLGISLDRSQSRLTPNWVQKPDRTGL